MKIFVNTLYKERIATLYKTAAGVPGHAKQIQQEVNRLDNVEGRPGNVVDEAIKAERSIREALREVAADKQPAGCFVSFGLLKDRVNL